MQKKDKPRADINYKEMLYELCHRLWIIILAGMTAAGVSYAVSRYVITPVYESKTSVYVISREYEDKMTLTDLQTGIQLAKDYMFIVKSRPVTQKVIETLNLDMTNKDLADLIDVGTPLDTRILEITVKHTDPKTAKAIADTIAKVSGEQMVKVMNMESVNIIEEGSLPTKPSGPNVIINTAAAGILGAAAAAFAICLVYYFNDHIRTSDDIERYLKISTLGVIPVYKHRIKKKHKKEQEKSRAEAAVADMERGFGHYEESTYSGQS